MERLLSTGKRKVIALVTMLSTIGHVAAKDTSTAIFAPSFHTLEITVNDNFLAPDVIILGSNDLLTVEFDEFGDDKRYLRASITHCDASWQPSALVENEYINRFNLFEIDDVEFSNATLAHYVHYRLSLTANELGLKKSGNYLLRIFDEQDPETTLLQARFYVTEASAVVRGSVSTRTDIDYNSRHQQLTLSVDCRRANVDNIYTDLKVTVNQNNRPDTEIRLNTPSSVSGYTANYQHFRDLIFPATNEYHRFETISTNYPGMHVENVEFADPYYHMTLTTDYPRSKDSYLYDKTQHGRFLIRAENTSDSSTEADYTVVHFSLDAPHYHDTDVYLDGDFLNRRLDANSRMVYNPTTSRYEKTMLLKQGSYNYQYLTPGKISSTGSSTSTVDGDFASTVNEYHIKIYARNHGDRADRLIGYAIILSASPI